MPTKSENNIELGIGTLYFYTAEEGAPVEVGPVKSVEMAVDIYTERDDTGRFIGPLRQTINQELTFEAELGAVSLPLLWRLTGDPRYMVKWAKQNHPRLYHLAVFAKTARRREKNGARLARLFVKEAFA